MSLIQRSQLQFFGSNAILFDNYEIKENLNDDLEFNNNGINMITLKGESTNNEIELNGKTTINGDLEVNGTIIGVETNLIKDSDNTTSITTETIAETLIMTTNSIERMRIDSSGNVGIGTNNLVGNSDQQLHINNNNGTSSIIIERDSFGGGDVGYIRFRKQNVESSSVYVSDGFLVLAHSSPDANSGIKFETGTSGVWTGSGATERMRIDTSGNVGIGNTNPTEKLEVNGNTNINGIVKITKTDGEKIQLTSTGSAGSKIMHSGGWTVDHYAGPGTGGDTGNFRFFTTANSTYTERIRILANGNVGIGKTNPTEKLDVVGNIFATGTIRSSTPGQLLNTVMLRATDLGTFKEYTGDIVINTTTYTTVASHTYNRVSNNSWIMVRFDCAYYIGGNGTDSLRSRLTIGGLVAKEKIQYYNNAGGGGGRACSLTPIEAVYRNTATGNIVINFQAARLGADDFIAFTRTLGNENGGLSLVIQEIAR